MEPEIEDESEARSGEDSWAQAETRRLMELVRFLARTLGVNNSALARNADVPLATLVRYFKGEGEPKLEFLLSMVKALGLEVREFFELAYPDAPVLTPARAKIGRIMQAFQPTRPATPPPPAETNSLQRDEMEQMMERLRNDMRELLAERGEKAAPRRGKKEG